MEHGSIYYSNKLDLLVIATPWYEHYGSVPMCCIHYEIFDGWSTWMMSRHNKIWSYQQLAESDYEFLGLL